MENDNENSEVLNTLVVVQEPKYSAKQMKIFAEQNRKKRNKVLWASGGKSSYYKT